MVYQKLKSIIQFFNTIGREVFRKPKHNVYEEIFPALIFLRISLILHQNFTSTQLHTLKRSRPWYLLILSFIHSASYTVMVYLAFWIELDSTHTRILYYCNRSFLVVATLISAVMMIYFQFLDGIWSGIEHIKNVDKQLEYFGYPVDYNIIFRIFFIGGWFIFAELCSVIIYDYIRRKMSAFMFLFLTFVSIGTYLLMVGQYAGFLVMTFNRIKQINACLKVYYCDTNSQLSTIIDLNNDIRRLEYAYNQAVDSIEQINGTLGIVVMFYMGQFFMNILLTLFCLFVVVMQNYLGEFDHVVLNLVYCSFYVLFYAMIIVMGTLLQWESGKTMILIHRACLQTKNDVLYEKLLDFSQLCLHRRPLATCYLFNYNLDLLGSTLGALTIYVIILIQFERTNL